MSSKNFNPQKLPKNRTQLDVSELIQGLEAKDRVSLSRAITLLESTSVKHASVKKELLEWAYSKRKRSKRVGITGSPGVGKSSFIEQLGKAIVDRNETVAVLSIDPSSSLSGGSILGDKTRMEILSAKKEAYIRPSPSSNILGGVAGATRESVALCEALEFDWIIVETVGVGQSEYAVHQMTDLFLLMLLPGAGDSLQGIKRGIVEMSDLAVVNKSDGDRIKLASETRAAYNNALRLFGEKESGWVAEVHQISALEGKGILEVLDRMDQYFLFIEENDFLDSNRKNQALIWFREALKAKILSRMYENNAMVKRVDEVEQMIKQGSIAPGIAADVVLDSWISNTP